MRTCAYCGKKGQLSKEHLYPDCLQSRRDGDRVYSSNAISDKFVPGSALQIKDVCETCNNGVLSELDQYFCGLYDSFIDGRTVRSGEQVQFRYEYDDLLRWLLKMLYNNARAGKAAKKHVDRLQEYSGYIIGEESIPPEVLLLARLTVPFEGENGEIPPSHMTCGLIELEEFDYRLGETYLVSIDSFSFIVVALVGASNLFRQKARELLKEDASLGETSRLTPGVEQTRLEASDATSLHVDGQLVMADWAKWIRRTQKD
ncbi:HNH endonuclease [Salinibacter sp. 10B]|uniref:HNH endonuclease n=1 Tax=Salinibacter sp. 10B TaxID=1923971 RepID=UPI0011B0ED5C|nr:HNH endonuclease [Salinibacter sp. 10B]